MTDLPKITDGAKDWLRELEERGQRFDPRYALPWRWAVALEAHGYITMQQSSHGERWAQITDAGREYLR